MYFFTCVPRLGGNCWFRLRRTWTIVAFISIFLQPKNVGPLGRLVSIYQTSRPNIRSYYEQLMSEGWYWVFFKRKLAACFWRIAGVTKNDGTALWQVWFIGCRRDWKGHVGRICPGGILKRNFKCWLKTKDSSGENYEGIQTMKGFCFFCQQLWYWKWCWQ